MIILIAGLVLFVGVHLLRELNLRESAINRLGLGRYRLAYSLIAAAGFILIIWGKSSAPFVQLYQPIYELRYISHWLMIPAFILFTAGNLPTSYLRSHTLHPMLLGTAIWGSAHLWANGDLASVLLFGSFVLWSLIKVISLVKANQRPPTNASIIWDVTAVIVGFLVYAIVLIYHGQLFGIGLGLE
jgi:uncharacterized membrane protein